MAAAWCPGGVRGPVPGRGWTLESEWDRAAGEGTGSAGLEPSGFLAWLTARQEKGRYAGYDPDADYERLAKLADGAVPLRL